jgi:hypothetical protein
MTTEEIKTKWQNAASHLEGELQFSNNIKAHVNAEIISAQIDYHYQNIPITVHQAIYIYGKRSHQCTLIEYSTRMAVENYELRVWKLDFLDKILKRSRPKLDIKEFDKIYGIYTSNINTTKQILYSKDLIQFFFTNKNLIINALPENDNAVLYLKGLNSPIDFSGILKYADFFNTIVDQLLMHNLVNIPCL